MKLLTTIRHRVAGAYRAITNQVVGGYEMLVDVTRRSDSGVSVNARSSMEYAPIYYAVTKMAGFIGMIPKRVLIRKGDDVERVTKQRSPLVELLNLRPNVFMSSMDLFETAQKDAQLSGNGRVGIVRNSQGEPETLILINPADATTFISYPDPGRKTLSVSDVTPLGPVFGATSMWHLITAADGTTFVISDQDVLNVKGISPDGLEGTPLYTTGRNVIGGGLAAEKHVNRTMQNNGIPGLILEAPEGVLTDKEKAQEFLNAFRKMHEGSANASRTALLRYGVKANQLSQSGRDGQLIENRRFSRDDAFLITGDITLFDGGSAYANQQERDEDYKATVMARWRTKWEAECNIKLLSQRQRLAGWEIDFDESSILKGSLESRLAAYEIARRIGYMSQEEIRTRDGLPAPDPTHNFTNPATSSPFADGSQEESVSGGTDGAADTNGDEDDEPATNRRIPRILGPTTAQLSSNRRLSGWMQKERNALMHFASEPSTFLSSTSSFYAENATTILDISGDVGCAPWQSEHFEMVLDASECKPAELYSSIDSLTREWPTTLAAEKAGIIQGVQ